MSSLPFRCLLTTVAIACSACNNTAGPAVRLPSDNLSATISAPPDVQLELFCTPAQFELCFDAIDNNCNGAIDEGCGVQTGLLQFSIAWDDAAADVDLSVVAPNVGAAGGKDTPRPDLSKDRDCPGEGDRCQEQNTENIFQNQGEILRGTYKVHVRLLRQGHLPQVTVRFGARVGQRSYSAKLKLHAVGDDIVLNITL